MTNWSSEKKKHKIESARAEHARGRHEHLALRRETQLPYNFMHHDPTSRVQVCATLPSACNR